MTESLVDRHGHALMNTFGPPRLALERGEGARVWDTDGRCYVDLFGGIAVNALGHAHPALVEAVTSQLQTLGHVSNFFATHPQVELAERLVRLLATDGRVFLCNSGSEANEAAFKLTRRTGRRHLVAMEGSFHGRTMGALAVTAKEAHRAPFEPLPGDVTFVPYGDAAALEEAVTTETAAVVVEPLQGEAGVVEPPPGFLAEARRISSEQGALLWVDEVQTGIARTGRWFAHTAEPALVEAPPDIVTLAKGLGGGIPVGAAIATGETAGLLGPGSHGTTFGGNPVASAAALAVLDTVEREGLLAHATAVGARLAGVLTGPAPVTRVRGQGLLRGCVLTTEQAPAVVDAARARGYLLNSTGPDTLRLAPPLTIGADLVEEFAGVWPDILAEALHSETLHSEAPGPEALR